MLTAAEWNERYPPSTPVRYDGQVWTTVGAAGPAAGAEGAWLTLRGCGLLSDPRDVLVDAVEVLATDTERLAAGWLDPTGVEIVWDERDKAITERDEARARLNEVSNDRLAQLRRFAAEQPVITAARSWRGVMKLAEFAYGPAILRTPHSRALADAVDALDAAAETPPC